MLEKLVLQAEQEGQQRAVEEAGKLAIELVESEAKKKASGGFRELVVHPGGGGA